MKARLLFLIERLRTSYWLVPSTMTFISALFAVTIVELDRVAVLGGFLRHWSYGGGAEGARAVLETIASSMITVAGVVFSITVVALSLASSQFGPRLLRNFIRDRSSQFVLGTFVSTFVYCILVMRTVRSEDEQFVPHMSVAFGVAFALWSLGVLIFFIHHVAVSIQADRIIRVVSDELLETIDSLFPEKEEFTAQSAPAGSVLPSEDDAAEIAAGESGYLSGISVEELVRLAEREDLFVRIVVRPGHFIVRGSVLCRISPRERLNRTCESSLAKLFVIGQQRTALQDLEFTVNQLVEIAVRALSPGVNDPFTAVICVDRIGEALCRLAERKFPPPEEFDSTGRIRVVRYPVTFSDITDAALNQIRQYGRSSVAVSLRLLDMLAVVARFVRRNGDRVAVERHAALVLESAMVGFVQEADRVDARERYKKVLASGVRLWPASPLCQ